MERLIKPSIYSGDYVASPSKSYMQRAIAIALLSDGKTVLNNPCFSDDSKHALKMAENLGAKVTIFDNKVVVNGTNKVVRYELTAGESGLGIRCFVPIAALFDTKILFHGKGSLKKRPLTMLETPLRKLGAEVQTSNGYLPVTIKGPIKGGEVEIDGSISSQVLTGFLIALPKAKNNSKLLVNNLKSIPYIDMTIQIMKGFGVSIEHENYQTFYIKGNQTYKRNAFDVESDWSGAAFHLVGGAMAERSEEHTSDLQSRTLI